MEKWIGQRHKLLFFLAVYHVMMFEGTSKREIGKTVDWNQFRPTPFLIEKDIRRQSATKCVINVVPGPGENSNKNTPHAQNSAIYLRDAIPH